MFKSKHWLLKPALAKPLFDSLYNDIKKQLGSTKRGEFGADMKVVATGGLAQIFAGATGSIHEIDLDLTTRGLVQIFRRNTA